MLPAMPTPETLELLSFRRTFTMLILLVVLPSAGLSGFGVVAIINERAAVEKRLGELWSARLTAAELDLRAALAAARVLEDEPELALELGGARAEGDTFRATHAEVQATDPKLKAAVQAIGNELGQLPERLVFFSVPAPQATFLLGAVRHAEVVRGLHLGTPTVDRLLTRVGKRSIPLGEQAHFALVPVKHDVPEGMLARLMSGVSEAKEAALGPPELASITLPSPLQDFRLVAIADGEDPVARASTRNRAVYGVLLGLFYVTLAIGVIFTGRTLYREAKLSKMKTDFVSLVSHELRTPLTSIRMFIEMLALGRVKDPQEMQTVLDLLSKETERLSAMIEGVLDWARIESGKKEYRLAQVAVKDVCDAAVSAFRAQRVGATVDLSVDVAEGLPVLQVDKDAIAGALLNLLQNAFKYTGEDKRIRLRARLDDGGVVLEVEDNGIGIPKREQKRVFERFYRVDGFLSRATEGSGLGLSIATRIVQAHGGRMSVDSVVGKGSTFRIHLPVAP